MDRIFRKLSLVACGLFAILAGNTLEASNGGPVSVTDHWKIVLPQAEDSIEAWSRLPADNWTLALQHSRGIGFYTNEIVVVVEGQGMWETTVDARCNSSPTKGSGDSTKPFTLTFVDQNSASGEGYFRTLGVSSDPFRIAVLRELETPPKWSCDVVVRIERIRNRCSMWAQVSGDVYGTFYGDVAYFNTFDKGTGITTGTYADPGMHQMLQDWAGAMGDMAEWMQAQGHPVDPEDLARLKSNEKGYSQAQEDLHRAQKGVIEAGGDKFGLTLADSKFDAPEPKMEGGIMSGKAMGELASARDPAAAGDLEGALASILDAVGSGLEDMQGSGQMDALAQGLGAMAGMFTLEASAPGEVIIGGDDYGSLIKVPLSTLVVAPGGIDEVGRIPFAYSKEQGIGAAHLEIRRVNENFIYGTILGELYTEGTYANLERRGKIKVVATFTALRGANSCH